MSDPLPLADIVSQLSAMGPADLLKVRKTVDMLLGEADAAPSSWDGHVWDALRKCLGAKGLRLPHCSAIQASADKKRRLSAGALAIREFLESATRQTDDHHLRTNLAFVMDVCVQRLEKGNAPMSTSVLLNQLPDFPAYVASAFPGCSANPKQFSLVRALFSQRRSVS